MKIGKVFAIGLGLFLWASILPRSWADEWNQATKITFSAPVEIPGAVLAAGTYYFTLLNDDADRNIVQIWNADRTKLIATELTVANERLKPTGKTVIKFSERPVDTPEALRAWFYPGDNYGHEFVYPESAARRIAKRVNQPVLSMRDEMASETKEPAKSAKDQSVVALKGAQVNGVEPSGQEVSASEVATAPPKQ
jgi:Protein of unknown function (DUF2911)